MYKKMPEYYEPYQEVKSFPNYYMELSKQDAGVICGLLKQYRPKKILEVGVSAGGSTCLILKCLEMLGLTESRVYSIDLNERFYRDKERETGWFLKENISYIQNYANHKFLLGKVSADRIEEVGDKIDFLFLDTMHSIPGEILDFLLWYPYLSPNAIVVMHDTNLHNERVNEKSICTRVLVNAVTADKFYTHSRKFLNIGAFRIIEDTKKYIEDVFASLLLPWTYYVDTDIIQKYREAYRNSYPEEAIAIFDNAIEMALYRYEILRKNGGMAKLDEAFLSEKRIFIYGCGKLGKKLLRYIDERKYTISGIVVSDEINIEEFSDLLSQGKNIFHFSDIPKDKEECIIILATMAKEVQEKLEKSVYDYIELEDSFWDYI